MRFSHVLLHFALGCFVATASSALTYADVIRCIDETGAITYTNLPCSGEARNISDDDESSGPKEDMQNKVAAQPAQPESVVIKSNWENISLTKHRSANALDVETLQAAKESFLVNDRQLVLRRLAVASN